MAQDYKWTQVYSTPIHVSVETAEALLEEQRLYREKMVRDMNAVVFQGEDTNEN